jgi:hypothetical protein
LERFIECYREEHPDLTWHWAICGVCRGHGTSTRHLGAYTQSDREEMGDEWYEFMDDVRAGHYDQPCPECGGSGKVQEFTGEAAEAWDEWCAEEAADRYTCWAESGYPQ